MASSQSNSRNEVPRYTLHERIVHWTVGILFVYLMLSGLALFSPHLYWLAYVLGGGATIARWHPIAGVAFSVALALMLLMWWRDMKFDAGDREWLKHVGKYVRNEEEGLPPAGRFNAGQKQLFWLQASSGTLLLFSGIPLWFPHSFPPGLKLAGILIHGIAALAAIAGLIVHVYMGTAVVRGSLSGMIRGKVSRAWARAHHLRWYREVESREAGKRR